MQSSAETRSAVLQAPAAIVEEDEGGDVDESGVEAKDVELVMTQVPPPPFLNTPRQATSTFAHHPCHIET